MSRVSLFHGSRASQLHRGAPAAEPQRKFSEFLSFAEETKPKPSEASEASPPKGGASTLVDRATSLLAAAREALDAVRQREPADSRNRRSGPNIKVKEQAPVRSQDVRAQLGWEGEEDDYKDDYRPSGGGGGGGMRLSLGGGGGSSGGSGGGGGWGGGAPGQVNSWFADKVDTGAMAVQRSSTAVQPIGREAAVAVLDQLPQTLEFGGAPAAAAASAPADQQVPGSIFPASLQLRFETEMVREQEDMAAVAAAVAAPAAAVAAVEAEAPAARPAEVAPAPEGDWERRHGEERGPGGYWYRWTEVRGGDAAGQVHWYERWWEVSDWSGMKEMGAEKCGANANGDAWRETWREAICIESNGQPYVDRSAHKWAKSNSGAEWEEKWGEHYHSAGSVDKWAEKWGREGADIWHEKWGENYDGYGGCVKYTDKWAEREHFGGGREQWGDKWEERFKDGRGSKQGETWSVAADGNRYNRWWGENHFGDGWVQKFGNSNTGEHWDVSEQMDTYYNCIPHFTFRMAINHSPDLKNVPMAPREGGDSGGLGFGGGGLGFDGGGNGDGGLGSGFSALQ